MAGETAAKSSTELREDGNQSFRAGDVQAALALYSRALDAAETKDERLVIHKNRAQCYLKLKRFKEAEAAAAEALKLCPGDVKALFRQAQALEALERPGEALRAVRRLLQVDPRCAEAAALLRRVEAKAAALVEKQNSTAGRIESMLGIVKDPAADEKTLVTAINNLTSLCPSSTSAGTSSIILQSGLTAIVALCHHKSIDVVSAALTCLIAVAQEDKQKSLLVLEALSSAAIFSLASHASPTVVVSAGALLKSLLFGLTRIKAFIKERDAYEAERKRQYNQMRPFRQYEVDADVVDVVDNILSSVVKLTNSYKVSAVGRDSLIQVLISIISRKNGIYWTKKFLKLPGGIQRILEVGAATGAERPSEGPVEAPGFNVVNLKVTRDSRMHAAVLLNSVFEDLRSDQERTTFNEACLAFVIDLLSDDMLDTKVEAMNGISTLLQGPFEVGLTVIAKEGILEGMLLLAKSNTVSHQRAALETIVHSCSKRDKCSGIIGTAVPILRELYQSSDIEVKVRALVGLCKLGSSAGGDASLRAMADGSSANLARSCIRLLQDTESSSDTAQWAVEGLAYLSLEAEVKEELVSEEATLKRLMQMQKDCSHGVIYPLATVLVNLTNSYERPEILPEMRELAQFSKQHVPEDDPRDAPDYLQKRVQCLVAAGCPSALYSMTTRSAELSTSGTREQISRIYLAIVSEEKNRGCLVQAGAGKALLQLATDSAGNSEAGCYIASRALAKIGITMDPRLAFPGQRSLEVVRPLLQLLNIDRSSLENYEALMALTNVATIDDRHRERILKEKGFGYIEHYMFESHEDLRRAAVECVCNLAPCERLLEHYRGENDRVKLLVLFSSEYDDPNLVRAASGALAILARDAEICQKITKVNNWLDIIQALAANPEPQVSHRGVFILKSMIEADRDLASFLIQGNTLEMLMAITQVPIESFAPSRDYAKEALDKAVEYGLITPAEAKKREKEAKKNKKKEESKEKKEEKKEEKEEKKEENGEKKEEKEEKEEEKEEEKKEEKEEKKVVEEREEEKKEEVVDGAKKEIQEDKIEGIKEAEKEVKKKKKKKKGKKEGKVVAEAKQEEKAEQKEEEKEKEGQEGKEPQAS